MIDISRGDGDGSRICKTIMIFKLKKLKIFKKKLYDSIVINQDENFVSTRYNPFLRGVTHPPPSTHHPPPPHKMNVFHKN